MNQGDILEITYLNLFLNPVHEIRFHFQITVGLIIGINMNIVWLHDNINDHTELDKYLQNFEKPIVSFIDSIPCIGFLTNSNQQKSDRPSIVIVLNRVARQIVPEIHSFPKVLFIIVFCVKKDNKIKWISKYNKVRCLYTCGDLCKSSCFFLTIDHWHIYGSKKPSYVCSTNDKNIWRGKTRYFRL